MAKNSAVVAREAEAQNAFRNYVQSVAFNLTLSRSMIEALALIRDGMGSGFSFHEAAQSGRISQRTNSYAVPVIGRLISRGLVIHDYLPPDEAPKGHRYYKLTRAGAITCALLIEAGLMAPEQAERRAA